MTNSLEATSWTHALPLIQRNVWLFSTDMLNTLISNGMQYYICLYAQLVFLFNMEYATARHDDVVGWFDQNETEQSWDIIPGIS